MKTKTKDNRVIHILEQIPQHSGALEPRWAVFYDNWHWSMSEEELRGMLKDPHVLISRDEQAGEEALIK